MVRKGELWERPVQGPHDLEVHGDDHDLARAIQRAPGALVLFRPSEHSDIARAVGLFAGFEPSGASEIPMDALRLEDGSLVCNMAVIGAPVDQVKRMPFPLRAAVHVDGREIYEGIARTIVVAIGQFLGELDVVPRGHPGDGRAEVQVYDLRRRLELRAMRTRMRTGTHLPHPSIREASGRRIDVSVSPSEYWVRDRRRHGARSHWTFEVVPEAYRILI